MIATLDKPIHTKGKTAPVIWKTVEKGGVKYTLQVCIDTRRLEREIAEAIEDMKCSHEFLTGNLIVNLTRSS